MGAGISWTENQSDRILGASGAPASKARSHLATTRVATVVVGKWTGDLDVARMQRQLNNETDAEANSPEAVLDATETHMPVTAAR